MTVIDDHPAGVAVTAPALEQARARRREEPIVAALLAELVALPASSSCRRSQIRDELVVLHLPLAEHLARRFGNRGEPIADLAQVATIGLIKAIDGFDPGREVNFTSYAIPTIVGEIKRHFRDKGWSVRVPRRLKEMKLEVARARMTLTQQLGRMPTHADLAMHLGVTECQIRECILSAQAYAALSLDTPIGADHRDATLADLLGGPDKALDEIDVRESLHPLIAELPARQRTIIGMRFYGNMTQTQIAERIGISQMHVSRLITRSLAQLRQGLAWEG